MLPHPTINTRAFVTRAANLDIRVDGDGRQSFEEVLQRGANKTNGFRTGNVEAYEKAFEVLSSAAITAAAKDHATQFGRAHITAALVWVCPLFPFCG